MEAMTLGQTCGFLSIYIRFLSSGEWERRELAVELDGVFGNKRDVQGETEGYPQGFKW